MLVETVDRWQCYSYLKGSSSRIKTDNTTRMQGFVMLKMDGQFSGMMRYAEYIESDAYV